MREVRKFNASELQVRCAFDRGKIVVCYWDENRAVIFKLWVMDSAATSGRWPVVDEVDLATVSAVDGAVFFRQDRISGKISAYDAITNSESSHSFEEADRLECAAVWSPEHIEDRLHDHLNGIPNKWWASTRPRKSRRSYLIGTSGAGAFAS